jgi:hypothetical protein
MAPRQSRQVTQYAPSASSNSSSSTSGPAPSKNPEDKATIGQEQDQQQRKGYPGQITGSRKSNRLDPGDDEDDSSPEDEPLDLGPLSPRSLYALRNLSRYGRIQNKIAASRSKDAWDSYYPDWPKERRAGVMVALFGGKTGELNVVLSTRALDLRVNVSLYQVLLMDSLLGY